MDGEFISVLALAAVFTILLVNWLHSSKRSKLSLPPGPRKLPFIGNILSIPSENQWLAFSQLAKELGMSYNYTRMRGNSLNLPYAKVPTFFTWIWQANPLWFWSQKKLLQNFLNIGLPSIQAGKFFERFVGPLSYEALRPVTKVIHQLCVWMSSLTFRGYERLIWTPLIGSDGIGQLSSSHMETSGEKTGGCLSGTSTLQTHLSIVAMKSNNCIYSSIIFSKSHRNSYHI